MPKFNPENMPVQNNFQIFNYRILVEGENDGLEMTEEVYSSLSLFQKEPEPNITYEQLQALKDISKLDGISFLSQEDFEIYSQQSLKEMQLPDGSFKVNIKDDFGNMLFKYHKSAYNKADGVISTKFMQHSEYTCHSLAAIQGLKDLPNSKELLSDIVTIKGKGLYKFLYINFKNIPTIKIKKEIFDSKLYEKIIEGDPDVKAIHIANDILHTAELLDKDINNISIEEIKLNKERPSYKGGFPEDLIHLIAGPSKTKNIPLSKKLSVKNKTLDDDLIQNINDKNTLVFISTDKDEKLFKKLNVTYDEKTITEMPESYKNNPTIYENHTYFIKETREIDGKNYLVLQNPFWNTGENIELLSIEDLFDKEKGKCYKNMNLTQVKIAPKLNNKLH